MLAEGRASGEERCLKGERSREWPAYYPRTRPAGDAQLPPCHHGQPLDCTQKGPGFRRGIRGLLSAGFRPASAAHAALQNHQRSAVSTTRLSVSSAPNT